MSKKKNWGKNNKKTKKNGIKNKNKRTNESKTVYPDVKNEGGQRKNKQKTDVWWFI